jgi:hypothetical protein
VFVFVFWIRVEGVVSGGDSVSGWWIAIWYSFAVGVRLPLVFADGVEVGITAFYNPSSH